MNQDLIESILKAPEETLAKAAGAWTRYIRAKLREGEARAVFKRIFYNPELSQVPNIARLFAISIAEEVGEEKVEEIDQLNDIEPNRDICHSHDFCDANVHMHEAILSVTGINVSDELANLSAHARALWECAWDYTKICGFKRLSAVRGVPDNPTDKLLTMFDSQKRLMTVVLPGTSLREEHPIEVAADYWGRNPRLQFLCYEYGDPEGEPKVVVRYGTDGRIEEVLVKNTTLIRDGDGEFYARPPSGTRDTGWEIDRDSNPPCAPGDRLQMPSGQIATVMRLQDRYEGDFEQFKAYAETYGILERLDGHPGQEKRHQVYNDLEQAWEVNPLTAGTTEPSDFSFVPEYPTYPTPTEEEDAPET